MGSRISEGRTPDRKGAPWTEAEIALVVIIKESQEAKEVIAKITKRTADAIDFCYSWKNGHKMPKKSSNRILRLLRSVRDSSLGKYEDGVEV